MSRLAFINGLLAVILAVLGLGIWSTWARQLPPEPVVTRTPAPKPTPESHGGGKGKRGGPDKNAAAAAAVSPAAMVTAIVEKDLFDPSRQKQTEEAAKVQAVAKVTEPPAGVTVVGLRVFGKDREAFVTDPAQGTQQRRLRVGDQVGGYTVQQITVSGLTLTSPSGDPVTMMLNIDKAKAGGAAVAKPPAGVSPRPPGQPPTAVTNASPAAGIQAPSPAAGIGGTKPATLGQVAPKPAGTPTAAAVPGAAGQMPTAAAVAQPGQLPPDVQDKLQRLKEHQGSRLGRKQR
jgi:hypothetical protein